MRAPREKTLTVSWRKKDKAHIFLLHKAFCLSSPSVGVLEGIHTLSLNEMGLSTNSPT